MVKEMARKRREEMARKEYYEMQKMKMKMINEKKK